MKPALLYSDDAARCEAEVCILYHYQTSGVHIMLIAPQKFQNRSQGRYTAIICTVFFSIVKISTNGPITRQIKDHSQ